MEHEQSTLFGFGIDQTSKTHLWEAARWAKFLAIFGIIVCVLIAVLGVFAGAIFSSVSNQLETGAESRAMFGAGLGVFMTVLYVGIAILYFFPCLFLLRFANHMRNALATTDQVALNNSFQNLKITFRYLGILTIVLICIYVLAFFVAIVTAASGM